MKCVCGYEIINDIRALQDPFLDVYVELEGVSTDLYTRDWKGDRNLVFLKACPKCGTVKISV